MTYGLFTRASYITVFENVKRQFSIVNTDEF